MQCAYKGTILLILLILYVRDTTAQQFGYKNNWKSAGMQVYSIKSSHKD